MDYKRMKTQNEAVTRNVTNFDELTGNLYETIAALSKRSDQISAELRQELMNKISEFTATPANTENIEETFENREQIEIARYYEQLPKSTLIAIQELLDQKLGFRRPEKEKEQFDY